MIRVLVPCTVEPHHLPRALEVYRELAEATRAEEGCRAYDLLQDEVDPTRFVLAEEWDSHEHLAAHTRTEHFVRLVRELAALESAAPAQILRTVV